MELGRILERVTTALRERDIAHAPIGGLALAAHGAARATLDVDLLVPGERADDVDALLLAEGPTRSSRRTRSDAGSGIARRANRKSTRPRTGSFEPRDRT